MATKGAIPVCTAGIYANRTGRENQKETPPGIQIEIKWARQESEVKSVSREQGSDQELSEQDNVLSDTTGRLTCVGW